MENKNGQQPNDLIISYTCIVRLPGSLSVNAFSTLLTLFSGGRSEMLGRIKKGLALCGLNGCNQTQHGI